MEWRPIEGYLYPYRINEEAQIEKQLANGTWKPIATYMVKRNRHGLGVLCATLRVSQQKQKLVTVKSLMIDSFLGGKQPGKIVVHKNKMLSDCAWYNLQFISPKDLPQYYGPTRGKTIKKVNKNGEIISVYKNMKEAAKDNHISKASVERRCNNKVKNPFELCGFNFCYDD